MGSVEKLQDWAESLVGRDWEIYWNDDEDNDAKDEAETAPMDVTTSPTTTHAPEVSTTPDTSTDKMVVDKDENDKPEPKDDDDESEGSIIDDWYAGRILKVTRQESGVLMFKVLFVGDEEIYDMELEPAKVRPSARGWIKRTISLLRSPTDQTVDSGQPWHSRLPADTAMGEDRHHIKQLEEDFSSKKYESIVFVDLKENIELPSIAELQEILRLRHLLQAQIFLRSKLAPIVNLHGSMKYIDGEPNPTEPLVNHLVSCCKDLDSTCQWYLQCWELLTTCFTQRSGQSSNEGESTGQDLNYESIVSDFLEYGKVCLVNAAAMDVESTSSKRKHVHTSPPGHRRAKRRRKHIKWGPDHSLETIADEGDIRSTFFVDTFVNRLNQHPQNWSISLFGKMLRCVSHYIVDPLVRWQARAHLLLGIDDDYQEVLDEHAKEDEAPQGDDSSHSDEMSTDSEMQQQMCTYDDIESCLHALEENRVLSLLNVSSQEDALRNKLQAIEQAGDQMRRALSRISEDPSTRQSSPHTDEVLSELQSILSGISNSSNALFNVDPIGKPDNAVSRGLVEDAVSIREWLIGATHILATRERKSFVSSILSKVGTLPDLKEAATHVDLQVLNKKMESMQHHIGELQKRAETLSPTEQDYSRKLDDNTSSLPTREEAKVALAALGNLPVILFAEEEYCLLLDLMEWEEQASDLLASGSPNIEFTKLEKLYVSLQKMITGKSKRRVSVCEETITIEKLELELRQFVGMQISKLKGNTAEKIQSLYSTSSIWKEKAEAIISALRMHGHMSITEAQPSLKLPSMVDIKRIHDLLQDYDGIGVEFSDYVSTLKKVFDGAIGWSTDLHELLSNEKSSFEEHALNLEKASLKRPKGLIMDPTRQVLEMLQDLLGWYGRTRACFDQFLATTPNKALSPEAASNLLISSTYPLLAEGVEIVHAFSVNDGDGFETAPNITLEQLDEKHGIRRSARSLTKEKVDAHELGAMLLKRLASAETDKTEGYPISCLLWCDWHLRVAEFIANISENSEPKTDKKKNESLNLTLKEALDLMARQPVLVLPSDSAAAVGRGLCVTVELQRMNALISDAQGLETEIRELISKYRDFRKGSIQKAEEIRSHVARLKEIQGLLKDRTGGIGGLALDSTLDAQVDQHMKLFFWMARTFSYPFLYLDEATYSSMDGQTTEKDTESPRVPWGVLVSLFEKLPPDTEEKADDFSLVSLRIQELFDAAKKWQDDITRNTLLSNRGGKRRAPIGSPSKGENDDESSSKLQIEKMKQLVENPILCKVAMPRENAVTHILQSSTEFEGQLHAFLGKDFEGKNPDRAAFPDQDSLVGKKGEFVLYRLTGSELFETMLDSMNELVVVAENVLAETPGKSTFDWIRRAVNWIESLNDAVTSNSPFPDSRKSILIIPSSDARQLVRDGEEVFLVLPEDLKKTLSRHGIYVSTNKQERTLKVNVKKGGAHHSVGGTVIRWCPILFECLRADVERLEQWERELTIILSQFNKFFAETRNNPKSSERDLYRWYCFREKVATLLRDGSRTLVVSPQQGLVSSFSNLLNSLQNYLAKHSNPDLGKKFAKMWFAEGTSLLDDRLELLESLIYRKSVSSDEKPNIKLAEDQKKTFRETCRAYLITSFSRAVKSIGMTKMRDVIKIRDLESFCSLKAWEIENEMFERFQGDLGLARVSDEYKSKARSLRASLDNRSNLALCLRILVGDISASSLVSMTGDQLVSQKVKLDRARAVKAAMMSSTLTREKPEKVQKHEEKSEAKVAAPSGSRPASILRGAMSPQKSASVKPVQGKRAEANEHRETKEETDLAVTSATGPKTNLSPSAIANLSAAALKKLASKSSANAARPPPPPSLVTSFQQGTPSDDEGHTMGERVSNADGSETFRIEIVNLRLSFHAALHAEDNSFSGFQRFLPASFSEKGRLPDQEFSRFVSEKLAGGRWMAIPLRLSTLSDQDAKDYKKFYQAYEVKRRIAMFAISPSTKVFLVTPKFHGAAKATGLLSLPQKTSTYAVVLTKDAHVRRK